MAHSLHTLLVKSDSAIQADAYVRQELKRWVTEDVNYFQVCAVLSENGLDEDLENFDSEFWSDTKFVFLAEVTPKGKTHFDQVLDCVKNYVAGPIFLEKGSYEYHECNLDEAKEYVLTQLKNFTPGESRLSELGGIVRNSRILHDVLQSREQLAKKRTVFEFRPKQYDEFGLTDWTGYSEGQQLYVVIIDMHS